MESSDYSATCLFWHRNGQVYACESFFPRALAYNSRVDRHIASIWSKWTLFLRANLIRFDFFQHLIIPEWRMGINVVKMFRIIHISVMDICWRSLPDSAQSVALSFSARMIPLITWKSPENQGRCGQKQKFARDFEAMVKPIVCVCAMNSTTAHANCFSSFFPEAAKCLI